MNDEQINKRPRPALIHDLDKLLNVAKQLRHGKSLRTRFRKDIIEVFDNVDKLRTQLTEAQDRIEFNEGHLSTYGFLVIEKSGKLELVCEECGSSFMYECDEDCPYAAGYKPEILLKEAREWAGKYYRRIADLEGLLEIVDELQSTSDSNRDDAVIATSDMDNPIAIPWLEKAAKKETNSVLKENIWQVIVQLKITEALQKKSKS